jgi:transcriptional regulator with XRE-family HTH domain
MQKKSSSKFAKDNRFSEMAQFLKEKRIDRGLSQSAVAKMVGFGSPQFVSNWERGLCSPSLNSLPKLSRLLKIRESEIIEVFIRVARREVEDAFSRAGKASRK